MKKNINSIIIVGSGEDYTSSKLKYYSDKSDFIIASDGGLNALSGCGIKPDLIIGDLDSVNEDNLEKFKHVKLEKYPPEKDFTDSELAIHTALDMKPGNIYLLGMTGSYLDHSLANVFNLLKYVSNDTEMQLINSNSTVFVIRKSKVFSDLKNRRISFFPFSGIKGLDMKGFKYIFNKIDIGMNEYGISNIISENYAEIIFNEGCMICVLFDEGYG